MTTGPEPPAPAASVVVATYQRRHLLRRLVHALEAQRDVGAFEVVVVDDGSTDGTADELAVLAAASAIPVRALSTGANRGPAVARNLGWRAARAPVIAFTDDDCVPDPTWLTTLVARLAGADVVQGRTDPDPEGGWLEQPFAHSVRVDAEHGFYETCNIAYRREVLERLDGFDERFRHRVRGAGPTFGEDTDLAWRAIESGARVVFEPAARVVHDVTPGTWLDRLRAAHRREGMVQLVARHPGMRARLPAPWVYRPAHPWALLAAAGIACAARRPASPVRLAVGLLCQVPYCHVRTKVEPVHARRRSWPVVLPQMLAVDLADIAVLLRAGVRHRTVLL